MDEQKIIDSRQDHTEEELYPDKKLRDDWKKPYYPGGLYSASEIGGEDRSQQNPWQGTQDQAKSEQP